MLDIEYEIFENIELVKSVQTMKNAQFSKTIFTCYFLTY